MGKYYRSGIFCSNSMMYTPESIGALVRQTRKAVGAIQKDLALTSGTGLRFIIELEKGKATCQLGKVLTVVQTLGISMDLHPPKGIEAAIGRLLQHNLVIGELLVE